MGVALEITSCCVMVGSWFVRVAVGFWLLLVAADEGCWVLSVALGLGSRPVEDGCWELGVALGIASCAAVVGCWELIIAVGLVTRSCDA